jgi:hypothetical protein
VARRGRARLAAVARRRVAQLLERVDHSDDGAEQAHEGRGGAHGAEQPQVPLQVLHDRRAAQRHRRGDVRWLAPVHLEAAPEHLGERVRRSFAQRGGRLVLAPLDRRKDLALEVLRARQQVPQVVQPLEDHGDAGDRPQAEDGEQPRVVTGHLLESFEEHVESGRLAAATASGNSSGILAVRTF